MQAKVLSAKDKFIQKILKDFRFQSDGKSYVAKLESEGRLDHSWEANKTADPKVFVQFLSYEQWKKERLPFFQRWFQALRFHYLSFTLLPQLLVFAILFNSAHAINWLLVSAVFAATTFLHLACTLWNDYEDHIRGVDAANNLGGSGVIHKLMIPAIHLRHAAWLFLSIGAFIGLSITSQLSWQEGKILLLLGTLGTIGAAGYSGWPFHYKYLALGELLVFFLCGPLLALGAAIVFFHGSVPYLELTMASIPLGLLAVLRLHGGNIQRIPYDSLAQARTIANIIGFHNAKFVYLALLFALYMFTTLFVSLLPASPWLLLSCVSLPVAFYQFDLIRRMHGPLDPLASKLKKSATYLDLSFGVGYCLGAFFWIF